MRESAKSLQSAGMSFTHDSRTGFPRIVADPEEPRIEFLEGDRIVRVSILGPTFNAIEMECLGLTNAIIAEAEEIRRGAGLEPLFSNDHATANQ